MMLRLLCSLLSLVVLVAATDESISESESSAPAAAAAPAPAPAALPAGPVGRVVQLLQEMQKTLIKDMIEDEKLHGKLSLWCEENSLAKKKAIKAGNEKISTLEQTIEALNAKISGLQEKIKALTTEMADNKNALAQASAVREKELAEFSDMEKEAVANIANLKNAILVLSKHQSAAFPQLGMLSFLQSPWGMEPQSQRDFDKFMDSSNFAEEMSLRMKSAESNAEDMSTSSDKGFLQKPPPTPSMSAETAASEAFTATEVETVRNAVSTAKSFLQKQGEEVPDYNSESGEIYGVLEQLQEDMENDLKEAQTTESKRATDFSDLRETKLSQIAIGEKSIDTKKSELAQAKFDNADAKQDLGESKATLAEDMKFADNLKTTCDEANVDFAQRKKSRLTETKAVSDTIAILMDEEAKSAAAGTFKPSYFLQLSSNSLSQRRHKAANLLRHVASRTSDPDLALIASSTQLDAFTEVKASIDKMVNMLSIQQSDEVKKKDWCKHEFNANEMSVVKATDLKADLDAKAEDLRVTIKKLDEEIAANKDKIALEQAALQNATDARKAENLEFQKDLANQQLTVKVLLKAIERLKKYYDKKSLIQTKQTPPVAQMKYSASQGAAAVMSLLEKVTYDAKEIMAESKKNEAKQVAAYEELAEDSNNSIKALTKSVLSKTDSKVEANRDLKQKTLDSKATAKELVRLAKYEDDLHQGCDFVLKNFNLRQQARSEEMVSLRQAKDMLNGGSASLALDA